MDFVPFQNSELGDVREISSCVSMSISSGKSIANVCHGNEE
jgi:hypothetical protein